MQLTDWARTKEILGELNLKRTGKSLWGHGMYVCATLEFNDKSIAYEKQFRNDVIPRIFCEVFISIIVNFFSREYWTNFN